MDEKEHFIDEDDILEVYEVDDVNDAEMEQNAEDSSESSDEDDVHPECDHSSFTFRCHTAPVYSCAFHPNGRLAASGCENEMLYVWDSMSNETLLEEKFEDSVTLIKFNHNGKYLVAVDMIGNLCCWKFSNNEFMKMRTMKLEHTSWMEWHPLANVLIFPDKLEICMWKVPSNDEIKYFMADSYSEVGCFMPDGKNALIGYNEGYAVILNLSSFTVVSKLKHHDMNSDHGIVSLDVHPDNNLVALGSKNGRVILFTKAPKVVGMIDMPTTENGNYIEVIKFGLDSLSQLLLVAFSNYLHIYDQSKLVLRHKITISGHATRLVCVESLAYVATSKAVVEVCDCRTGEKKSPLEGHCNAIVDMTLSKDGQKLMTSSDDTSVKIFNLHGLSVDINENPETSGQL